MNVPSLWFLGPNLEQSVSAAQKAQNQRKLRTAKFALQHVQNVQAWSNRDSSWHE